MTPLYDVRVAERRVEGNNTVILTLVSVNAAPLPSVTPGDHIDVHLPNGMIRQYSLCQDPRTHGIFRLGILRDAQSRGGSITAFDMLLPNTELKVSAPKNLFPLIEAPHIILIGGGIGITPLITMAYQLHHDNRSFELHYCGADLNKAAFITELRQGLLAKYTTLHFKSEGASHRAFFDSAIKNIDKMSHIYTCGPAPFMDWITNLAIAHQFDAAHIHKEYFQIDADTHGDSFTVVAQQSGKTITVQSDETILQALAKAGIDIEMSCEQGVCGTCMCDVIEGEPDHRDVYFTDEEKASNEQILVCCSRSKSPTLVLDI